MGGRGERYIQIKRERERERARRLELCWNQSNLIVFYADGQRKRESERVCVCVWVYVFYFCWGEQNTMTFCLYRIS